jgi:orotidine-5'-phosphate decarboxylase
VVRIIAALDLPDATEALALARRLRDHVDGFKVGLGLLHRSGLDPIAEIAAVGLPVFADAKLDDIPTQVERAATALGERGARWVTAHASGGAEMLRAAVSGLAGGNPDGGILAVTVLTSLDRGTLAEVGIDAEPGALARAMASVAATTGCEGLICSPHELGVVTEAAPGLLRVVPGIRPAATEDDQARTAAPAFAVANGADYLVVGRPITAAPDPVAATVQLRAAVAVAAS